MKIKPLRPTLIELQTYLFQIRNTNTYMQQLFFSPWPFSEKESENMNHIANICIRGIQQGR